MHGSSETFEDLLEKLKAEYDRVQDENQGFRKQLGEDRPCTPRDTAPLDNAKPKVTYRRPSYVLTDSFAHGHSSFSTGQSLITHSRESGQQQDTKPLENIRHKVTYQMPSPSYVLTDSFPLGHDSFASEQSTALSRSRESGQQQVRTLPPISALVEDPIRPCGSSARDSEDGSTSVKHFRCTWSIGDNGKPYWSPEGTSSRPVRSRPIGLSKSSTRSEYHNMSRAMCVNDSQMTSRASVFRANKRGELAEAWLPSPKPRTGPRSRRKSSCENFEIFPPPASTSRLSRMNSKLGRSRRSFTLQPSSLFIMLWKALQMILLLTDLVLVPLDTCLYKDCSSFLLLFAVVFWSLDVGVSFCTAYVDREGKLEKRLHRVAIRYCRGRLLPDLVFLGIEWTFFVTAQGDDRSFVNILCFARLLKVVKMQALIRTVTEQVRSNITLTVFSFSKIMAFILLCTHWTACGWQVITVSAGEVAADDLWGRHALALHWVFSLYGLGAASYPPIAMAEYIYANLVATVFILLFPVLMSYLMHCLSHFHNREKAREQRERQLREYLRQNQVSWTLRNRIWFFIRKEHMPDGERLGESSVELVQRLPHALIFHLRAEVFIPTLTSHPFFGTYAVSQQDRYAILHLVETGAVFESSLKANDELFGEGDKAFDMHFLVHGTLLYKFARAVFAGIDLDPALEDSSDDGTATASQANWWVSELSTGRNVCGVASDGADVTPVFEGSWLSEPVLWLKWLHVGTANAKTHCEFVFLEADKFQTSMRTHLPGAEKFARLYLKYFQDHQHKMNDVYTDMTALKTISEGFFNPPIKFSIGNCWPGADFNWHPSTRREFQKAWATVWKPEHTTHPSSMIYTMHTDMKHDVILMYQTLFAQNSQDRQRCGFLTEQEVIQHDKRVLFLKRLILCLAVSRLAYSSKDNGTSLRPWPFPLASALCHGGRVLLRLVGVSWEELVSLLVNGDVNWVWSNFVPPEPLNVRMGSSHVVQADRSGVLQEKKVRGVASIRDRRNFGMDVPVGGLGNPAPSAAESAPGYRSGQLCIGPAGVPFRPSRKVGADFAKDIQHGHVYMRVDDFSTTSLLRGFKDRDGTRRLTWRSNSPALPPANSLAGPRRPRTSTSLTSMCFAEDEWSRMPQHTVNTLDDLENTLRQNSLYKLVASPQQVAKLYEQLQSDLVLEKNVSTNALRCRGVLIYLLIVIEGCENEEERFLSHESAFATSENVEVEKKSRSSIGSQVTQMFSRSSECTDMEQKKTSSSQRKSVSDSRERLSTSGSLLASEVSGSRRVFETESQDDKRVLTVLCKNDEDWAVAVARYCFEVLQLSEPTVEKIFSGLHSEPSAESFSFTCGPSPTICHHHIKACADDLDLEYTALRLCTRLCERDWIGASTIGTFRTSEKVAEVWGFWPDGGSEPEHDSTDEPEGPGFVVRIWRWLPMSVAADTQKDFLGRHRPEQHSGLRLERVRQGSVLIGIESSSPHKTDLFGNTHTVDAKSKDISAFGKRKWRDYESDGHSVPAKYGGIRSTMTAERFQQFKDLCARLPLSRPSDGYSAEQDTEKELFQNILWGSDEILESSIQKAIDNTIVDACNDSLEQQAVGSDFAQARQSASHPRAGAEAAEVAAEASAISSALSAFQDGDVYPI